MREKTLEFMACTLVPFDHNVEGIVNQFKSQFRHGFGEELPPEALEALGAIKRAFETGRAVVEDRVAALYEKYLDEADLYALLAFQNSPAGKKLRDVCGTLMQQAAEITSTWVNETMTSVESDLNRLLGGPAPAPTPSDAPVTAPAQ